MTLKKLTTLLLTVLLVAACSNAKEIVGEADPPAEPLAGLYKVVGEANAIFISRFHLRGDSAGRAFVCSGFACTSGAITVAPAWSSVRLFSDGFEQEREIGGTKIVESNLDDGDWSSYGAWMDHAATFLMRFRYGNASGGSTDYFLAYSFGSSSEAPLPVEGTATWRGAMVGVDVLAGDRYAGDANLVASFADDSAGEFPTMDVSFTGIANVETGTAREDILFRDIVDVGIYEGGRFTAWSGHENLAEAPIYIDGRLFGPNHKEAAGIFGYNELIGAFGARKQD